MKHIIAIFLVLISCLSINAEVRIHMEKEGGVYKVPCSVNGLKLKFIFDTGASNVCISETYADMMLENGYLKESDIKGVSQSTIADGSNIDNVVINLRMVEIGGLSLENVSAVVVPTQNAPLLLGQSVIQRLGKVSIDGEYLVIHNANNYTEEELDAIYDKAEKLFENNQNLQALESYRIIYETYGDETGPWVLYKMGICYSRLRDYNSSIKCHLKAIELASGEEDEDDVKFEAYYKLGLIYYILKDFEKSVKYYSFASEYTDDLSMKAECYNEIALYYFKNQFFPEAIDYYKKIEKIHGQMSNIDASAKAKLFHRIGLCYGLIGNKNDHSRAIEYFDKAITIYNSQVKKRETLDEEELHTYISSYHLKGSSLGSLLKYEEAIDAFNMVKELLNKYKNQIADKEWYESERKSLNNELSVSYKALNE